MQSSYFRKHLTTKSRNSEDNGHHFFTSYDVVGPTVIRYTGTHKIVEKLKKHELISTSGFEITALSGVTMHYKE